jgi:hypothetical protein
MTQSCSTSTPRTFINSRSLPRCRYQARHDSHRRGSNSSSQNLSRTYGRIPARAMPASQTPTEICYVMNATPIFRRRAHLRRAGRALALDPFSGSTGLLLFSEPCDHSIGVKKVDSAVSAFACGWTARIINGRASRAGPETEGRDEHLGFALVPTFLITPDNCPS